MSRGRPVVYRSIAEISHTVVAYIHVAFVSCVLEASHYPPADRPAETTYSARRLADG